MVKLGKTERRLLEDASRVMDNAHVLWGFEVDATMIAEDGKWIMAVMLKAESTDWGVR